MQKIDIKLIPINSKGVPIKNKVEYANRMSHLVFSQDSPSNKIPIQKNDGEPLPYRIKFRMDKLKGFKIKLTRDDGTLVDPSLLTYIYLIKSTGIYQPITYEFDSDTKYWTLRSETPFDSSNGYWIDYLCTDGIATQYPYRYKTVDKRNVSDLIMPGYYTANIPYWHIEYATTPTPEQIPPRSKTFYEVPPYGVAYHAGATGWYYVYAGYSYKVITIVKSSVPYKVNYPAHGLWLYNDYGDGFLKSFWIGVGYELTDFGCIIYQESCKKRTTNFDIFNERPNGYYHDTFSVLRLVTDGGVNELLTPMDIGEGRSWESEYPPNISGVSHYTEIQTVLQNGTWTGDIMYANDANYCSPLEAVTGNLTVHDIYIVINKTHYLPVPEPI
jgi:hypothetical protein